MRAFVLSEIPIGTACVISRLGGSGTMKQRLMDLGFVEGTRIVPVLSSIFKNPRAYSLRGTIIALRNDDAAGVEVKLK